MYVDDLYGEGGVCVCVRVVILAFVGIVVS